MIKLLVTVMFAQFLAFPAWASDEPVGDEVSAGPVQLTYQEISILGKCYDNVNMETQGELSPVIARECVEQMAKLKVKVADYYKKGRKAVDDGIATDSDPQSIGNQEDTPGNGFAGIDSENSGNINRFDRVYECNKTLAVLNNVIGKAWTPEYNAELAQEFIILRRAVPMRYMNLGPSPEAIFNWVEKYLPGRIREVKAAVRTWDALGLVHTKSLSTTFTRDSWNDQMLEYRYCSLSKWAREHTKEFLASSSALQASGKSNTDQDKELNNVRLVLADDLDSGNRVCPNQSDENGALVNKLTGKKESEPLVDKPQPKDPAIPLDVFGNTYGTGGGYFLKPDQLNKKQVYPPTPNERALMDQIKQKKAVLNDVKSGKYLEDGVISSVSDKSSAQRLAETKAEKEKELNKEIKVLKSKLAAVQKANNAAREKKAEMKITNDRLVDLYSNRNAYRPVYKLDGGILGRSDQSEVDSHPLAQLAAPAAPKKEDTRVQEAQNTGVRMTPDEKIRIDAVAERVNNVMLIKNRALWMKCTTGVRVYRNCKNRIGACDALPDHPEKLVSLLDNMEKPAKDGGCW